MGIWEHVKILIKNLYVRQKTWYEPIMGWQKKQVSELKLEEKSLTILRYADDTTIIAEDPKYLGILLNMLVQRRD